MRRFERLGLACVGALAFGCSALIEPDPSRLGGDPDAGQSDIDSGRSDAGRDAGRDAGDPPADGGEDAAMCPPSCDDEVACTIDACSAGSCTHAPDDAACGAGERCSPTLGCVPERCASDAECDDGLFCNGAERCDTAAPGTGCVSGDAPDCDDGASCTADRCDEDADRCANEPNHAACADSVDCTVDACDPGASGDATGCVRRPDDSLCAGDFCTTGRTCRATGCSAGTPRSCLDGNPCTSDACDSAAAMCVNPPRDDDGDGAPAASATGAGGTVRCTGGTDCDDGDAAIRPGAAEVCGNGDDDDCDGMIDDGCATLPDDCSSEDTLDLRSVATTSVSGTFSAFRHDYQTSTVCGAGSNGRDAVYAVVLPRGTFDVTIDTIGSAADTVLGVGFDCSSSGFQAACNDDYGPSSVSTASRIWLHRVGSPFGETTFYVLVDAYDSATGGAFQLNVQRTAARADRCPSSGSLAFDMSGGGTLIGFQTEFTSSTRGSCQPSWDPDPEAVLFFRAPSSGAVDFDVYSVDFVPDIYIRESPCSGGTELDCDNGASIGGGVYRASLRETGLTPGDAHFLFVDGGRTAYVVYFDPY